MSHRKLPAACMDIPELRVQIDTLDQEIITLLSESAGYIDRAIALKQANGWPARIPGRVEEVVLNARVNAEDQGLDGDMIETFWRQLVDWSIAREARFIAEETNQGPLRLRGT